MEIIKTLLATNETVALKDVQNVLENEYERLKSFEHHNNTLKSDISLLKSELVEVDEKIQNAKKHGLDDLKIAYEAEKAEKLKLEKQITNFTVDNAIQREMKKYNVVDDELVYSYIKGNTDLNSDNKVLFDNADLEIGLKTLFETKPSLLKSVGSGSVKTSQNIQPTQTTPDFSKLSLSEIVALSEDEKNKYLGKDN